jgi:4-hydroxythreonine-4-phosphate dehydrogenase
MGPKECGSISMAAVDDAVRAVMQGEVSAIVTAPINKAHWKAAGSPFMGHTEYLAHVSGAGPFAMMMASPKLKVSLVTTHIPLADVPKTITIERICEVVRLTCVSLRGVPLYGGTTKRSPELNCVQGIASASPYNDKNPVNIAVCALNPHAGEAGAIGKEEETVIIQAVKLLQQEGLPVSGPYPADTVFHRAVKGEFAAVVAMYHDQGLAPIKTLDFARTVNVTLGLPFVRTSPDHGTAEDIAGKRIASHENMVEAIKLAVTLCHSREACPSPD